MVCIVVGLPMHAMGTQKAQKLLSHATVDKSFIKLAVKPAITFSPIPMKDRNGKPIDPNATAKLPNGKVITARDYFAQLNAYEERLNKIGYSLKTHDSRLQIGATNLNPEMLQRQTTALKQLVEPNTVQNGQTKRATVLNSALKVDTSKLSALPAVQRQAASDLNSHNLAGDQIHGLLVNPADIKTTASAHPTHIDFSKVGILNIPFGHPQPTESTPVSHSKSWNWDYGNSWFGAYFDGSFNVSGVAKVPANTKSFGSDLSSFSASTNGKAGVKLFTENVDLVSYNASYSGSDSSKQIKINADVSVLGYTVWSDNQTVPNGYKIQDTKSIPLDVSTPTLEFPIGPFTIGGKLGAQGSAGISYSLALYYSSINGYVAPFVKSSAYGQIGGGIDLGIAAVDVGVGAHLTLLNDTLTIGANVGIGWLFGFYLCDDFYIDNALNALSGNVYFYVHESEVFGLFNQEQDFTVFNWGGIQDNSTWVNVHNIIPLDWKG